MIRTTPARIVIPDVSISVEKERIVVRALYKHKDRCKLIAGARWEPTRKVWHYPATPSVAGAMQKAFRGLQITTDRAFDDLLRRAEDIVDAAGIKTSDELSEPPLVKTPSWKHQRQAFWFVAHLWGGLPNERGTTE